MRTTRIRKHIKEFLKEKPRSTKEILDHINTITRHGTTSQQLANVLSKDISFIKVGYVNYKGHVKGSNYKICQWSLNPIQFPQSQNL